MDKLTHQDTLYLQEVLEIGGDLLLLPRIRLPNISETLQLQRFGIPNLASSDEARVAAMASLFERKSSYVSVCEETGREPPWIEELPAEQRRWLRYHYATQSEDPLVIVNELPHTGVSYMVREGGLCEEVERLFNLRRLQYVKQLGFLQQPWMAMSKHGAVTDLSTNTRYTHSLDVMALATLIGRNLGLSEWPMTHLRVAAFTHDWGTPAGGDSVKYVDPKAFDEDLNYRKLLQRLPRATWGAFKKMREIEEDFLELTILNQGCLGQILDLTDKLAYVARDLVTCLKAAVDPSDDDVYLGMYALKEIVDEFPYVCSIWDSVEQSLDRLVFTDIWRLLGFLKARIILFRELYYHPRARFGEYLISRVLVKLLYDRGELTREELLVMTDDALKRKLDNAFGAQRVLQGLSAKTQVRSFRTREEALRFKRELEESGNRFALVEDHLRSVKTGADWLVRTKSGTKPLYEAYPGDARQLHEMATMNPAVHVYYFGDDPYAPKDELADLVEMIQRLPPAS